MDNRPYLKLKNAAFGQDFMFYGTFIPCLNLRLVILSKAALSDLEKLVDRVIFLESSEGHSIGDKNASTILLANFLL